MADNSIDIKENYIKDLSQDLLSILLVDHSSKKNIIWATDDYKSRGKGFSAKDQIKIEKITSYYGNLIKPRTEKSKTEIQKRIKNKAEVFTPSWVCNSQNNLVDEAWFGCKPIFNIEEEKSWKVCKDKIVFSNSEGKTWMDYVVANRLEVSCGEAPYLVSRYDTVTGDIIQPDRRIGLLDRKLRIINENAENDNEWLEYVEKAFKSIYGFDWQGDNVLLSRENMLFTFIDYYIKRFNEMPNEDWLKKIADIISWNIWQMDGLKFVIPNSCVKTEQQPIQFSIFEEDNIVKKEECYGCVKNNIHKHTGIYCKVKDWETNRAVKFVNLLGRKK